MGFVKKYHYILVMANMENYIALLSMLATVLLQHLISIFFYSITKIIFTVGCWTDLERILEFILHAVHAEFVWYQQQELIEFNWPITCGKKMWSNFPSE